MWKWISAALLAALIVTNGYWLRAALDIVSIEKYRQDDEYAQCARIRALQKIAQSSV
jgi:hypothetical protein